MVQRRFLIKRLLLLIPVLFGVATLVFAILHLSPGDPARVIAGQRASQEMVQQIRESLGLNDPIWVQYVRFLVETVQLELGESYIIRRGEPVADVLATRFPITLELALLGQLAGILFGIPLGILSAVKHDTITDHVGRVMALGGISIPIFWSGPVLILIFAVTFDVLPTSGRIAVDYRVPRTTGMILLDATIAGQWDALWSAMSHLLMPVVVIGIYSMAMISRMMRSSLLEVLRQDYMRTARAKGQGSRITIMKHGMRNAFIPVVTIIGLQFGGLLGGAVLTETVFNINGIGRLIVRAIDVGDYPLIQGTVLLFAFLFTLVNLGVDLTYSFLDPRIEQ
ncbi:MAG: ABC transporter permease [Halobacteriales archaeon]